MAITKKLSKVIGKEEYINSRTGHVEEFDVVNFTDADFNFEKIWMGHLLDALNCVGNKKVDLLSYMLKNRDSQNRIIGTQRSIAEEMNISSQTVNRTIKALEKANAIRKISSSVYQLNPDLIFKGGHNRRMRILLDYKKLPVKQEEEQQDLFDDAANG